MKHKIRMTVSTMIASVLLVVTPTAAHAQNDCATESRYDRLHDGLLLSSAKDIMNGDGHVGVEPYSPPGDWRYRMHYWYWCEFTGHVSNDVVRVYFKDYKGGDVNWVEYAKER